MLVSSGSTGGHYAQIKNGAPFEAFFAADAERPRLLEQEGIAVRGSRFLYAVGRLALWSPRPGYVDAEGRVLETGDFQLWPSRNPELAPYGAAARDVLMARNVWERCRRLVKGQDIGQAYSFVFTGNAELGFVAWAQMKKPEGQIGALTGSCRSPCIGQSSRKPCCYATCPLRARSWSSSRARRLARSFGVTATVRRGAAPLFPLADRDSIRMLNENPRVPRYSHLSCSNSRRHRRLVDSKRSGRSVRPRSMNVITVIGEA